MNKSSRFISVLLLLLCVAGVAYGSNPSDRVTWFEGEESGLLCACGEDLHTVGEVYFDVSVRGPMNCGGLTADHIYFDGTAPWILLQEITFSPETLTQSGDVTVTSHGLPRCYHQDLITVCERETKSATVFVEVECCISSDKGPKSFCGNQFGTPITAGNPTIEGISGTAYVLPGYEYTVSAPPGTDTDVKWTIPGSICPVDANGCPPGLSVFDDCVVTISPNRPGGTLTNGYSYTDCKGADGETYSFEWRNGVPYPVTCNRINEAKVDDALIKTVTVQVVQPTIWITNDGGSSTGPASTQGNAQAGAQFTSSTPLTTAIQQSGTASYEGRVVFYVSNPNVLGTEVRCSSIQSQYQSSNTILAQISATGSILGLGVEGSAVAKANSTLTIFSLTDPKVVEDEVTNAASIVSYTNNDNMVVGVYNKTVTVHKGTNYTSASGYPWAATASVSAKVERLFSVIQLGEAYAQVLLHDEPQVSIGGYVACQ